MFSKIIRQRYYNANINMSQKDTLHKTVQKRPPLLSETSVAEEVFYLSVFKPYYFFVRVVCAPVYTKSKFEYIKPQFVKLITPASVNVATTGVVIDL